jgi:hypothetical protein
LREATGFAVLAAAQFQARKLDDQTKTFDRQIQRYDRLRYLVDIQIEQRGTTISPLASVKAILSKIEDPDYPSPVLNKSTAALCIGAIYGDYANHELIDALTANTAQDTARTISLKELATLTCINKDGQYRYALQPSEDRAAELSDILEDLCVSLHDLRLYETVLNPARHTIEHNLNLSRAQESRTESDAKSMATQVAPLETNEKTQKPGRRSSKTKEQEPAAPSTIQGTDAQQELDTLENQAEAPQIGSYLREKGGYDALSPEQKAACDKDFQTHLDRRTRPIEVRDGETREDAVLRAKHEYCDARQEHTAHHRHSRIMDVDVAQYYVSTQNHHHDCGIRPDLLLRLPLSAFASRFRNLLSDSLDLRNWSCHPFSKPASTSWNQSPDLGHRAHLCRLNRLPGRQVVGRRADGLGQLEFALGQRLLAFFGGVGPFPRHA